MRKAVLHLKKNDPVMRAIIAKVGPFRMEYREPVFQTLVRSIVYQQLSGKAANTIFQRLAAAVGEDPFTPAGILKLSPRKMQAVGLSGQKRDYIRDLAKRTAKGEIDFLACAEQDDAEIIHRLTAVKGIGVWTVHMFLMFALRRQDVLPVGDLGVRAAIKKAYNLDELPKPAEMEQLAERWRPYCSIASWYLWRSLENEGAM